MPQIKPLASRMRPRWLNEYVGQQHLLAPGALLKQAIEGDKLHSMVLWGPPGSGKTTLARLIANHSQAQFVELSAVLSGVKEIRKAVEEARIQLQQGQRTVLFVDEVHRFNKSQQDAFLPHIEDGTFIFIGATTENPAFELNNALLSRTRLYVLKCLSEAEIKVVLQQALVDNERGLGGDTLQISTEQLTLLAQSAAGDARVALSLLDLVNDLSEPHNNTRVCSDQTLSLALQQGPKKFDKQGDYFYDQISALHKAVRGSDPDAALYWLTRMLDAGCDPLYLARRLVRIASEDIGNADPKALSLTLTAWDVQSRLGSPEGELALAQAVLYLAVAAKSNAVYKAYKAALADVQQDSDHAVPIHLRNAPTAVSKALQHGRDYRYAHDYPHAYVPNEQYFPEQKSPVAYYQPVNRGLEIKIADKLQQLRALDKAADG